MSRVAILSRKLREFWELIGADSDVMLRVRQDAQPVVIVGDLRDPLETDVFDQVGCIATVGIAAVVAQKGHLQLLNPTGSGKLMLLEAVLLMPGTAGAVKGGHHDTALTTASTDKSFRDSRFSGGPAGIPGAQTDAGSLITTEDSLFIADPGVSTPLIPLDIVLSPGHGYAFRNATSNDDFNGTLFWLEEPLPA